MHETPSKALVTAGVGKIKMGNWQDDYESLSDEREAALRKVDAAKHELNRLGVKLYTIDTYVNRGRGSDYSTKLMNAIENYIDAVNNLEAYK